MSDPQIDSDVAGDELFCPSCGYNLRGIQITRCPECGLQLDPATLGKSVIPWTHRALIGRWRAFWRTVEMVMRYPSRLVHDAARAVSYRDGQRFRWIVVVLAWLPMCATALSLRAMTGGNTLTVAVRIAYALPTLSAGAPAFTPVDFTLCFLEGVLMWPLPSICLLLFVAAVSGVGSYFFHPRHQHVVVQNRAVALSGYSSAAFSLCFVPGILLGTAAVMSSFDAIDRSPGFQAHALLLMFGYTSVAAIPFFIWLCTLRILKAATHCSFGRVLTAAVLLPTLWIALAILTCVLLPMICGFVKLLIASYLAGS